MIYVHTTQDIGSMKEQTSLQNHLLVAMPNLQDPNFNQSVVLICEYNADGAVGIVINKPMELRLGEILKHLQIPVADDDVAGLPVLRGGPLSQQQGFILYRDAEADLADKSEQKDAKISISSAKEDLISLANGERAADSLFSLGYASWEPGQLEQELAENVWLLAPANSTLIFDTPFEKRWREAAALIGVDFDRMSGEVGHA